jgi:hypothetical protein
MDASLTGGVPQATGNGTAPAAMRNPGGAGAMRAATACHTQASDYLTDACGSQWRQRRERMRIAR